MSKLLLVLVIGFAAVFAADECANLNFSAASGLTSGFPSTWLKCFNQLPVDTTSANTLMGILRELATVYSSTEYSCANISPYFAQVCLGTELNRIQTKLNAAGYVSDYDFHLDVAGVFTSLNDAHTQYVPPKGFSFCQINRIFTADVTQAGTIATLKAIGNGAAQFDGTQIISIDGVAPLTFFQNKALTHGIYRDVNVRFNSAIQSYFAEDVDSTHFKNIPDSELVVVLINGVQQTLNFTRQISCSGDRTTSAKVLSRNINKAKRSVQSEVELHIDPLKEIRKKQQELREDKNVLLSAIQLSETAAQSEHIARASSSKFLDTRAAINVAPRKGDATRMNVVLASKDFSFTYLRYKDIPVWKIASFFPQAPSDINDFFNTMLNALTESKTLGDTDLFIDVSGNGGGSVCLNLFTLGGLVQGWDTLPTTGSSPYQFIDVKKNTFMDAWVSLPDTSGLTSAYADPATGTFVAEDVWYNSQTVGRTIGGTITNFTKQGHWPDCGSGLPTPPPHFFSRIFLITDGTCGSACSQFESKLQTLPFVKVMTYGGSSGNIPDTSSFAGGNVIDWDSVLVPATSGTSKPATALPLSQILRFNHHISYVNNGDLIPREFSRLDSDIHSFLYTPFVANAFNQLDPTLVTQVFADLYETAAIGFGVIASPAATLVPSIAVLIALVALLF